MSALYIGRFQPFHLGHLDAVKQILKKEHFLIIGIGSAEDNYVPDNPFTASERYQMIEAALSEAKISKEKYSIIPVRNILNYMLWPDHVDLIFPPYERVYTGSAIVRTLYKKQGKHKVIEVAKNLPINSTEIRKKILTGKKWDHLLPKSVTALLKKWEAEERLTNISK